MKKEANIAVLIDADNASPHSIQPILREISGRGRIVLKRAYGDWTREQYRTWKEKVLELAITPMQQFAFTQGKNASDSFMIIDCMDLLYSDRYDVFVLVSSDSDFTRLASRLRESAVQVIGVGERKTPVSLIQACDEFLYVEHIIAATDTPEETALPADEAAIIALLMQAWSLHNEDDWASLSRAGSYLKRVQPDFDVRSHGVRSLTQLVEKLEDWFELRRTPRSDNSVVTSYRPRRR